MLRLSLAAAALLILRFPAIANLAHAQTATPAPDDAAPEVTAEATDDLLVITVEPLLGQRIPPPLTIELPRGWRVGHDTLLLDDIDALRNIPFSVYTGPVTGGTGTIVLLWAFPNVVAGNPLIGDAVTPDLYLDGTRLLRLAILEESCNIGTDLRREYSIGGLVAIGTQFAAVDCAELPNTRGWFAGLQQFNLNFVFYVFTDPIDAIDTAEDELQVILDSVRFVLPPTPDPNPEVTAEATAE